MIKFSKIRRAPKRTVYVCDHRKCEICSADCLHTFDVRHAKNFELSPWGDYIEKEKNNERQVMKVKLDPGAYLPERAHSADAGLDIRTPTAVTVPSRGSAVIDTGVHALIPVGMVGMLKSKSGLNVKLGITSEGVIDAGYTGSIVAKLYNNSDGNVTFFAGTKITQLVILPVCAPKIEVVSDLEDTERGENGFGSTGE